MIYLDHCVFQHNLGNVSHLLGNLILSFNRSVWIGPFVMQPDRHPS
jgi:hypothetical protein